MIPPCYCYYLVMEVKYRNFNWFKPGRKLLFFFYTLWRHVFVINVWRLLIHPMHAKKFQHSFCSDFAPATQPGNKSILWIKLSPNILFASDGIIILRLSFYFVINEQIEALTAEIDALEWAKATINGTLQEMARGGVAVHYLDMSQYRGAS